MYDIDILEEQWKKYKAKRRLPVMGFVLLIGFVSLYLTYRADITQTLSYYMDNNQSGDSTLPTNSASNSSMAINKDMPQVNDNNKSYTEVNERPAMKIELSDPVVEKEHERKFLEIIVTDKVPLDKTTKEAPETLKSIEKRFSESENYEDALYLANAYYKIGKYDKAEKYALASNNLNSNSEESWIIFAKAKAKLGQTKAAERILKAYLQENSSENVEKLLEKLGQGQID